MKKMVEYPRYSCKMNQVLYRAQSHSFCLKAYLGGRREHPMLSLSFSWPAAHQAGSLVSVCLTQVGEDGSHQGYCLGIRTF